MQIFLTGTDTNVGKTIIASWLCMHSKYDYWKPIQTGGTISRDTKVIQKLTSATTIKEAYIYHRPLSPHLAASLEHEVININHIIVPNNSNLIIEGAGGVLVPLNQELLMIDLIRSLKLPVILVTRSGLGTINHTLLTIEALRQRSIPILGVIVNGHENIENNKAIEYYGQIEILASFPQLKHVTSRKLKTIDLPDKLNRIFESV